MTSNLCADVYCMNVQGAIEFGLGKLGFKSIKEN